MLNVFGQIATFYEIKEKISGKYLAMSPKIWLYTEKGWHTE